MKRSVFALCLAGIIIAPGIGGDAAAAGDEPHDVKGSKDHPRISRFKDSVIVSYKHSAFGQLELPLDNPSKKKIQNVEGELTNFVFDIPVGHDSHEVYRTYGAALEKAGYSVLYKCAGGRECNGYDFPGYFQANYGFMGNVAPESQRYLAVRRHSSDGDSYVMLYAYSQPPKQNRVILSIIDPAPLDKGLVTVNAEAMAHDITTDGRAIVYGVYFDTDSATLKPDSDAALKEMARLLTNDAALKVFIVGHTDNVGPFTRNLDLSQKRAESVVKALAGKYRIDGKRLEGRGVGPFAPIKSNRTEEGRAKNRRVELVER